MDRIRRALDLARLQRDIPAAASRSDRLAQPAPGPAAAGSGTARTPPTPIIYHRTRVFTPSAAILEANRVINPMSTDPAATAFRMLRTQVLQRMDANGWRSLAIFSPGAHDGKTTTAINLAVNLANDRLHTVLLVEFDFQHPALAARIGLSPEFGGDDALSGAAAVEDCLYHAEGFDRFVILPARDKMTNSSEILAGPRSRELVSELRARYPERIIIFDLPPVLSADDALAFAPLVDCGLVVASEGRTRRSDLARTVELLHKTPLVGTVLNRTADTPSAY